jgi:hypothetical protein
LRAYVEAGGMLLIDACGGSPAFRAAVEKKLLPLAFPGMEMAEPRDDEVPLARSFDVGDDLAKRGLRPFVADKPGQAPRLRVGRFGKGHVVYSPIDLTSGLSGSMAWGIAGYTPDYSVGMVKNILLWAATMPTDPAAR